VASVTVSATAQGLCFGFQFASISGGIDEYFEDIRQPKDAGTCGQHRLLTILLNKCAAEVNKFPSAGQLFASFQ
jgi:hypothetical protein